MGKLKLGKGMDALFFENDEQATKASSVLRLSQLEPNKSQPRTDFDDAAIMTLAESIRRHGVLQPILVRPISDGYYQIVAGERRWRAARIAGLNEVPVLIREMSDLETMQIALIENLQREDLNPVEEAQGYQRLIDSYGMTQAQVAEVVGKSRSAVANCLRLLSLDTVIQDALRSGDLSTGHAKVLAGVDDSDLRIRLANRISNEGLSVRQTEHLVYRELTQQPEFNKPEKPDRSRVRHENSIFAEIELALNENIGHRVKINGRNDGSSVLQIKLASVEELKAVAKVLAEGEIDVQAQES